jgi:hypothetical protein
MDWNNPRSVEAKIKRLAGEIKQIDDFFYHGNQKEDRVAYAGMLERKRDDIVRSAVLQLHTATEDLLTSFIFCRVLGIKPDERSRKTRTQRTKALRQTLYGGGGIGFEAKLNLALVLGILHPSTKAKLKELNTLRNKCSHNWLLKATVRRGKRPKDKKPPLLSYRGQDLHEVKVFIAFAGEFGLIHARMFARYVA